MSTEDADEIFLPPSVRAAAMKLWKTGMIESGDITIELRKRGYQFENRSLVTMVSQLNGLGGSYPLKSIPSSIVSRSVLLDTETQSVFDKEHGERGLSFIEGARRLFNWVTNENLFALYLGEDGEGGS